MLDFFLQSVFEEPTRRVISEATGADDLLVEVDGLALADEVRLEHAPEVMVVLGRHRAEVRNILRLIAGNAAELLNALPEHAGMLVFILGMVLEYLADLGTGKIRGHEEVVPVLEERGPLASLRSLEKGDNLSRVGFIASSQCSIGQVLFGILHHLLQAFLPDQLR